MKGVFEAGEQATATISRSFVLLNRSLYLIINNYSKSFPGLNI